MEAEKAYLRKTDANGVSVYSHLTEVLATLLSEKPANALDMLEGVSLACKKAHYKASDEITVPEPPPETPAEAPPAVWAESTAAMLSKAPPEEAPEGEVVDFLGDSALFECAGVGLSASETYRVYASLVQLQQTKGLSTVRFFGKVLGVPGDYYIAEGVYVTPPELPEGYEPPPPPPGAPVEEPGTGCNKFTYFAASDPSGEWVPLPDVTPQQIVCSKLIRKYLTGDLEADVRAYPPFPGTEKAYLRALIARIVAATMLTPAGKYAPGEDGGEPTEAEIGTEEGQRTLPAASALGSLDGWVTRWMGVLDIGRTTNLPPPEEEEEDESKPKPPAPQEEIKYLSPLSEADWTAATYTHGGPEVAIARSLRWPGAYSGYCLERSGVERIASLYVGYGHEALGKPFAPEAPPPFAPEPPELIEQDDMPLEEENAAVIAAKTAEIAEEAANMEDPPVDAS